MLTPTEYKLLYIFVKNPGTALTRNLLLKKCGTMKETL